MAQGSIVLPLNGGAAKLEGADAGTASAGPFGRTLRIALAMKGGVSLAVWIGGAVAELDVLRRVRIVGERQDPRAVLLTAWPDGGDDAVIAEHERHAVPAAEAGVDLQPLEDDAGLHGGVVVAALLRLLDELARRAAGPLLDRVEVRLE